MDKYLLFANIAILDVFNVYCRDKYVLMFMINEWY